MLSCHAPAGWPSPQTRTTGSPVLAESVVRDGYVFELQLWHGASWCATALTGHRQPDAITPGSRDAAKKRLGVTFRPLKTITTVARAIFQRRAASDGGDTCDPEGSATSPCS